MTKWVNNDGLEVLFGTSKSEMRLGGETDHSGSLRELHFSITATDVPAADAPIDKRITIPSGAYIDEAVINVTTAFTSGGSATLDIGLMLDDNDGTYSTSDDNGIDAAIAVGTLVDNYRVVMNGAQINTTVTDSSNGLPLALSYGYNTAVFTAGVADIVIKYRV
jgi:uncharacterized protein YfcZ (UPF0381/DUF406 family)